MKKNRKGQDYLKGKAWNKDGAVLILRMPDGSERTVHEVSGWISNSDKEKNKWYLKVSVVEEEESKDSE